MLHPKLRFRDRRYDLCCLFTSRTFIENEMKLKQARAQGRGALNSVRVCFTSGTLRIANRNSSQLNLIISLLLKCCYG